MSVLSCWGDRPESIEDCAARLAHLLDQLGRVSEDYTTWWTTAWRRSQVRRLAPDTDELADLLRAGVNRTDFGGREIPELGVRASVWNGDDERSAGLNVCMGATAAGSGLANTGALSLVEQPTAYTVSDVLPLVRAFVDALEPEWVGVVRDDWLAVLDAEPVPGAPPMAWVMCLDRDRADLLPPEASSLVVETMSEGGVVVSTGPAEDHVDVDALEELQAKLRASGALRPVTVRA